MCVCETKDEINRQRASPPRTGWQRPTYLNIVPRAEKRMWLAHNSLAAGAFERRVEAFLVVLVIDLALDEHRPHRGAIVQRRAIEDQEIGVLALFNTADALLETEHPGRDDGESGQGGFVA